MLRAIRSQDVASIDIALVIVSLALYDGQWWSLWKEFLDAGIRRNRLRMSDAVDDTRVKLRDGDPNVAGSDYINANRITVSLHLAVKFY